eukprot:GHVL01014589.1.p1 GENE.GHVL01014589.1~~GHVL01014589.1.p1  ORF type:complete len:121 (+),score=31.69 GHVL01014589.1:34-396(+)
MEQEKSGRGWGKRSSAYYGGETFDEENEEDELLMQVEECLEIQKAQAERLTLDDFELFEDDQDQCDDNDTTDNIVCLRDIKASDVTNFKKKNMSSVKSLFEEHKNQALLETTQVYRVYYF